MNQIRTTSLGSLARRLLNPNTQERPQREGRPNTLSPLTLLSLSLLPPPPSSLFFPTHGVGWLRFSFLPLTKHSLLSTYNSLTYTTMDFQCHECGEPQSVWMVARCSNPNKASSCGGEAFCFKCLGHTYPNQYNNIFKGLWWICPVCTGLCKCETCSDPVSYFNYHINFFYSREGEQLRRILTWYCFIITGEESWI